MPPPRTADTMSDAIAMSSPNGRMSGRARKAAEKRLWVALFGEGPVNLRGEGPPPPTKKEQLLAHAARLRDLADRGMSTRRFMREAAKAEAEAALL